MNKYAVHHVLDTPYAYGKDKDTLILRIRVARGDIKKCLVKYKCRYNWETEYDTKEMSVIAETDLFTYYQTEISVEKNRYRYFFELTDNDDKIFHYNERGFVDTDCNFKEMISFQFPYIAEEDLYQQEEWLQEAVIYQIFPERFCNGNPEINPDGVKKWGKGKVSNKFMYGGDIRGIINKLDYLKDLGVDLLYLTPIFKSNTNHKYNTADYFDIDPQFGTMDDARELVRKSHEKGMKIVFDAVFNHSGSDFFAFKDVLQNQQESKYKDWYFIDKWPVSEKKGDYYTFANGCTNMPKLNTNNNEVRQYLLKVAEFWVKEVGIDGWRLDVCDEVGHDFWRDFKKVVKAANKNAIIVGEIMHEANSYLKGDQLDSIMNYPFKNATIDFFAMNNLTSRQYLDILAENRVLYMDNITKQMWNLVGSHDTKRVLTECGDDVEKVKLIMAMQFTYMGVPYIYYGDEVGINGFDDPDNRKCMIWEEKKQNRELYKLCQKLINIRKGNKELVHGDFIELYCKNDVIAFERNYNGEKSIVIINKNKEAYTINKKLGEIGVDLISGKELNLSQGITVEPISFMVIKGKK